MKGGFFMADLTGLATDIGSVSTWFWGLFKDFIEMISSNNLLLWSVKFESLRSEEIGCSDFPFAFFIKVYCFAF